MNKSLPYTILDTLIASVPPLTLADIEILFDGRRLYLSRGYLCAEYCDSSTISYTEGYTAINAVLRRRF